MAFSLLLKNGINVAIQRLEFAIAAVLSPHRFPPPGDGLCVVGAPHYEPGPPQSPPTVKDLIGNGFLWAVPKHRRTLEKKMKRKYGSPNGVEKILRPLNNIRTCNTCGDDHLAGVLCPTCYKKVIEETRAMQDAIQVELQLSPVENEVVVLYEGEKDAKPDEFYQGKRIVEMKKPRPQWFSKNLLQQTTQQPATTTDVKPSDLG